MLLEKNENSDVRGSARVHCWSAHFSARTFVRFWAFFVNNRLKEGEIVKIYVAKKQHYRKCARF